MAAVLCSGPCAGLALAAGPTPSSPPTDLQPQWRLVGPFRGGWGEMVEGVPARPDTFYFGAAGGGVWRTVNAGRTWESLFDHGPSAPVGAIAIAPSAPDTLYIGTGQPEPRYDVASGAGMFKSTDGGRTWAAAGLEATRHIGKIWVSPQSPNLVLVAAVGDFFGPSEARGVFRSTDGGVSWRHTLLVDQDTGAVDLAVDPTDQNTVFAATWQARQYPWQSYFTAVAGPGSGIYKSADEGVTWTRLNGHGWPAGPLGRISLAAGRTPKGLRLYAVISAATAHGLYRSDDGGASWLLVNDDEAFTSYYASRVTVDPSDPDIVYLVGQSIRRCTGGGTTCAIFKGAPGGDDYHHVWINPARPDHMATASDQGVVISVDAGRTWSSWYNQPTGQFYHLATDARFPFRIYAGQQDSGTVGIASRSDFGAISQRDWAPVGGDERDYDIPDPDDSDIVYSSGLGGKVNRFDARTGESADISPYPVSTYGKRQTSTLHHFVWVTPLAISKVGPTTLYLGGEVVFASTDRGATWSIISPDLTGKTPGAERCDGNIAVQDAKACGYGGIWSLAPSPRHAGEIWVGADDGLVHLTRDAGAHWTDVTPPAIPEWAKIAAIDVSPLDDGVAYIAVDNQRQSDLQPYAYVTRDYGLTWRSIVGDLPRDHFVAVVRADPVRRGMLYAGTDVGVFITFDDGGHWRPLQENLPTAWVRDLLVHNDDLIAGTQGRAIWTLGDLSRLRQAGPAFSSATPHLFQPAMAVRLRANNNHDTPVPPEEPVGQNPPAGAVIDYWLPTPSPVSLEIRDASGALVQRLSSTPKSAPPAELYFSSAWTHPPAPLSTSPGMHQVTWNLRWSRPEAIEYAYSLATSAGADAPITPEGPLALPGIYTVSLKAGGVARTAQLAVAQDPRSTASKADLADSLALSRRLAVSLALARRGYGEMAAVREQVEQAAKRPAQQPDLLARLQSLDAALSEPPPAHAGLGFRVAAARLADIESNLESTDRAPTAAQRAIAAETMAAIDQGWASWVKARDQDVASVSAALAKHGEPTLVIPAPEALAVKSPDGGEDLP